MTEEKPLLTAANQVAGGRSTERLEMPEIMNRLHQGSLSGGIRANNEIDTWMELESDIPVAPEAEKAQGAKPHGQGIQRRIGMMTYLRLTSSTGSRSALLSELVNTNSTWPVRMADRASRR